MGGIESRERSEILWRRVRSQTRKAYLGRVEHAASLPFGGTDQPE